MKNCGCQRLEQPSTHHADRTTQVPNHLVILPTTSQVTTTTNNQVTLQMVGECVSPIQDDRHFCLFLKHKKLPLTLFVSRTAWRLEWGNQIARPVYICNQNETRTDTWSSILTNSKWLSPMANTTLYIVRNK